MLVYRKFLYQVPNLVSFRLCRILQHVKNTIEVLLIVADEEFGVRERIVV